MGSRNRSSFGVMDREPAIAMVLSVVPGFGQFYNGESRKGLLFFLVTVLNGVALLLWVVRETLFKFFTSVATVMHVSLNQELKNSLLAIQANSPLGYALLLLLVIFTAYAMRDAFAKAHFKRLQAIYSSSSLAISEAAAGSYLMHVSLLFFVLLFVFFFCKQPPARPQITVIEFPPLQESPIPKKTTEKKIVSERANEATGKHNPLEKVTTATKGSRAVKPPAAHAEAQPKLAAAPPKPEPMPLPQPQTAPQPRPMVAPMPVPQPTAIKAPEPNKPTAPAPRPTLSAPLAAANPLPQPTLKSTDSSSNVSNNPLPTLTRSNNSLLAALPPAAARHQSSSSSSSGQPLAPGPIRDTSSASTSGSNVPTPVPSGRSSFSSSNAPGASGPPQPKAVEGGHSGKSSLPTPAVSPAATPGDNGAAKEGRGNPQAGARPDSIKTVGGDEKPDFSRFMADLQRRIKQAWYPPKAPASANCVLVFNVHLNGEMSGLRVQRSSGIAAYDNAALKAVENAAPFRPLPAGATEAVDVQFTFDYNVFQGGGGALKRF